MNDAQVQEFLFARYAGRAREVSLVGRGDWSVAYGFRLEGADYVARFGPALEDFEKDRLAARHSSRELPVPRLLEVGEALGRFYAISERAFGAFLETLDEAGLREVLPGLLAALDALRRVDVSTTTGYGLLEASGDAAHRTWQDALLAVGDDHPASRTHGWRDRLASSPLGDAGFEEALACLRELAGGCPNDRHLTHGDLLNRNVFVSNGRLAAVADWGSAMYADFLYELAGLTFWTPWFPAWGGVDLAAEAQRHYEATGLEVPGFVERLRTYEIHVGLVGVAYNAFRERWSEAAAVLRRTHATVERQPPKLPT